LTSAFDEVLRREDELLDHVIAQLGVVAHAVDGEDDRGELGLALSLLG
jgi:hypothetical protein